MSIHSNSGASPASDTASCLIPVPDWPKFHPWPTAAGLRHLIFNEATNGFGTAFKRIGRRVLVDEAEFFRCVERQQGGRGND